MKPAIALALFLIALAATSRASADPAMVEALIHEGVELRKQGKDHRAMPAFKKAYDLERSPRTAAQLGLVEAQLGYWLAAEKHLGEALSSTRNPWLAKHEPELRKTLENVRASIGEVEVKGGPAGAEVIVNGQAAGRLPLAGPVRVPEGAVQITMRAPAHAESSTSLVVGGGKRAGVTITLEPQPGTAAAAPQPAAPATSATKVSAGQGPGQDIPPEQKSGATWMRSASWAALVAGVAAVGLGGYGLKSQHDRGQAFDSYTMPGSTYRPCHEETPGKGGTECQSRYNKMKASEHLAIGGFAAGGVLLTAAVVGFILSPPDTDQEAETTWSLRVLPGTAMPVSIGWTTRF